MRKSGQGAWLLPEAPEKTLTRDVGSNPAFRNLCRCNSIGRVLGPYPRSCRIVACHLHQLRPRGKVALIRQPVTLKIAGSSPVGVATAECLLFKVDVASGELSSMLQPEMNTYFYII